MILIISLYGQGAAPLDRRPLCYLMFGNFWGFFIGLSAFELLAWHRHKLTIRDDEIVNHGVFCTRRMDLDGVESARWQVGRVGGLNLQSTSQKMKIDFYSYEPRERLALIHFFRDGLPESVQRNWDLFCYKIAIPLRYDEAGRQRPLRPGEAVVTRRRWDWLILPWTIVVAAGAFLHWRLLGQPTVLLAPLGIVALWLYLRWSTPRQGFRAERMSQNRKESRTWLFIVAWLLCGVIALGILEPMVANLAIAPWLAIASLFVIFAASSFPSAA